MARYLVTGGAGFIGSHLVDALVERGDPVRVLDNFATGKRVNLDHLEGRIELVVGDLRDPAALARAAAGIEAIFHQGALPSVPRSVRDPVTSHEVNATGTLNLLLAARDAGVRRVVFASSSSVYGDTPTLPKREDMAPAPKSPYAVSKLAAEHYCRVFHHGYGPETVCLRYFNVFGPRQDPDSPYAAAIPKFIRALLDGGEITIFGDGEQTRDFTYVSDVVAANLSAGEAPSAAGGVFNIAGGRQVPLNEVVASLAGITGRSPRIVHAPPRPGDVRHSFADVAAARQSLGYAPASDVAAGLALTVKWLQETPGPAGGAEPAGD